MKRKLRATLIVLLVLLGYLCRFTWTSDGTVGVAAWMTPLGYLFAARITVYNRSEQPVDILVCGLAARVTGFGGVYYKPCLPRPVTLRPGERYSEWQTGYPFWIVTPTRPSFQLEYKDSTGNERRVRAPFRLLGIL